MGRAFQKLPPQKDFGVDERADTRYNKNKLRQVCCRVVDKKRLSDNYACPGWAPWRPLVDFKKGKTMKSNFLCKAILAVVFCLLTFLLCGCSSYGQLGETQAEGSRRHQRALRINQSELMSDIDKALLFDQPSKLTDKRIP